MKHFLRFLSVFLLLLAPYLFNVSYANAADVRHDESITVDSGEKNLKNLYLFGQSVRVNAPVTNDIIAAGGDITLDNPVNGSIMATGGNINIKGNVGNSVRVAGGNIVIDGNVKNDLLISGGNILIGKNATIGGDVLFAGGTLTVNGPIDGKLHVAGGKIDINNTIGRGIEGDVGSLHLGSNSRINGDLKYTSDKKAQIDSGAQITGKTIYDKREQSQPEQNSGAIATSASVYKLIVDILFSLLFLYFFSRFTLEVIAQAQKSPLKNAAIGFSFLLLFPLAALLMLILIWLGIAAFLFYGLVLILTDVLAKLLVGWYVLTWYYKRSKKIYAIDWKAAVVGPLVLFVLMLIPVLGWLAAAIIWLLAMGAMLQHFGQIAQTQKITDKSPKKK